MDADKTYWEKTRRELHKDATSYIEQIPEVTLHETATVWPFTTNLLNHPNKTNKTCKDALIRDVLLWIPS